MLQQAGPKLAVAGLGDPGVVKWQPQSGFNVEMEPGGVLHLAIRQVELLLEDQGDRHNLGAAGGPAHVGVHVSELGVAEQLVGDDFQPLGETFGVKEVGGEAFGIEQVTLTVSPARPREESGCTD
jgi:hypothetical protein